MGTRADFWVGRDEKAEWIGSIAWDGHDIPDAVLNAYNEEEFRYQVNHFFRTRDDVSLPKDGWPWPWETSEITDCSYWFFDGRVWRDHAGCYVPSTSTPDFDDFPEPHKAEKLYLSGRPKIKFPNMKKMQKVALGKRSGLLIVRG